MDPVSKNAIVAFNRVLSDAGIESEWILNDPYNYAIVFGTGRGPHTTRNMLYESFERKAGRMVSGTLFSHCGYNMAAAMTAIGYGIRGPNLTFSGTADIGVCLLRRAARLLRSHRVHTVFVGFSELKTSTQPEENGLLKELAYILCLEHEERAIQRRANGLIEFEEIVWDETNGVLSVEPGGMYAIERRPENGSDFLERLKQAKKLDFHVTENLIEEGYLPLIKLGILANAFNSHEPYSSFLLPTRTKNGISVMTLRREEMENG